MKIRLDEARSALRLSRFSVIKDWYLIVPDSKDITAGAVVQMSSVLTIKSGCERSSA